MKRHLRKREELQKKVPKVRKLTVKENITLLPFLYGQLKEQSRSSVKALLAHGQILVNGKVISQFDTPLLPNDVVGISFERGKTPFSHPMLAILWEDEDIIVVNKKNGLQTVTPAKEKTPSVIHLLNTYVKKVDPRGKAFLLHQLSKDSSGLMIFARNRGIQSRFQVDWNQMVTRHTFVAVVEGKPQKEAGLLVSHDEIADTQRSYVVMEGNGQHTAIRYNTIKSNANYSLLGIELETKFKPNIREQMYRIGCPVAGDARYHAATDPANRLMLHSSRLYFIHPVSGMEMRFETPVPPIFKAVVK